MRLSETDLWLLSLGAALVGVVHLLIPGILLKTARWGYRWILAVEFDPKPGATGRVRLVGLGFLAVAAVLRRLSDH